MQPRDAVNTTLREAAPGVARHTVLQQTVFIRRKGALHSNDEKYCTVKTRVCGIVVYYQYCVPYVIARAALLYDGSSALFAPAGVTQCVLWHSHGDHVTG